jgi:hypothetical protein
MAKYFGTETEIRELEDSLSTSRELVEAICEFRGTEKGRLRVWADPSPAEEKKIIARAWAIVDRDNPGNELLYWGCCGKITR